MAKAVVALFEERVKQALKWYEEPERLGAESPLASPYFLSQAMDNSAEIMTAKGRGQLLQAAIHTAAATLWGGPLPRTKDEMQQALYDERQTPGTPRFAYLVLELRCFQQYLRPRRLPDIWEHEDFLLGSKTEHYRDYDHAVALLSKALLTQLWPTGRLEQPQAALTLIGYEPAHERVAAALQAGQTVTISGAGGIGKSSLGAQVVAAVDGKAIFWFTVRPTLNDHLGSLLFALGHFLHQQGASQLWQYLLASGGKQEEWHLALSLVREDLASLAANPPVLCFDELERLRVWAPEDLWPAHIQITEFIEGLRGTTPLLLIGQRPLIEADLHQTLAGLATPQILQLWQKAALPLTHEAATQLYHYTGGNPRLLLLCRTLQAEGELLDNIVAGLANRPGLQPIFRRLWLRLSSAHRRLLQQLAIFRSFVPDYPWEPMLVQELAQRRLIERTAQGAIALLPALREMVYNELSTELRQQLHLPAAHLRLELAQYTAAAYHFWQAGKEAEAVQAWFPQMQLEITRGQTDAALVVMEGISHQRLQVREQKVLAVVRATLRKLRGELTLGLAEIEKVDWTAPSELNGRARNLLGEFHEALGYPERAIQSYKDGVATVTRLLGQIGYLHYQRGMLHLRQKEIEQVQEQARLVEYYLRYLHGSLYEETGQYTDAHLAYQQALLLAQTLGEEVHIAQIESKLGDLSGRQQELEKALRHYENAVARYQQMGDRLNAERTRNNLAATYLQCRQFQPALEAALPAYDFFKAMQDTFWAALAATNAAEAYLEVGDFAKAQSYAEAVLDSEERQPYPYALFTLGRIKCGQQAWQEAQRYFEQAIHVAQMNYDSYLVAYVQRELAQVYQALDKDEAASHLRQTALRFFEQAGMAHEVEQTKQP